MFCPSLFLFLLTERTIYVTHKKGLIQAISWNANRFPLRLWVIDNSSSMQQMDAHVIRGSTLNQLTTSPCSRWQEAQDTITYFCFMASTLFLPTKFTMLNDLGRMFGPQTFSIEREWTKEFQAAQSIMGRAYPSGATPLTKHVQQIRNFIAPMTNQLRQYGQVVSIILATDGLPSDESGNEGHIILSQFVNALRSLEGLPVWVVVRLCTDDEKVFDFYNSIDAQINLPYDVLDDFHGEALEVYLRNPWLTYALPLHRFREQGFYIPVLDLIDERALTASEVRDLCMLLFQHARSLPDPAVDWINFLRALASLQHHEKRQFNSVMNTLCPWIDLRRLHFVHGRGVPFPPELQQQYPSQTKKFAPTSERHGYQQEQQQQFRHGAFTQTGYPRQPPAGMQKFEQPAAAVSTNQQQTPPRQTAYPQHQPGYGMPPQGYSAPPPSFSGSVPNQPPSRSSSSKNATGPSSSKYHQDNVSADLTNVKTGVLQWAVADGMNLKPIHQILATISQTFPPSYGIPTHIYFNKWKPISIDALSGATAHSQPNVVKRAVRKLKFFFHPDKLPKDFSSSQNYLCKLLWDIIADSLEMYENNIQ